MRHAISADDENRRRAVERGEDRARRQNRSDPGRAPIAGRACRRPAMPGELRRLADRAAGSARRSTVSPRSARPSSSDSHEGSAARRAHACDVAAVRRRCARAAIGAAAPTTPIAEQEQRHVEIEAQRARRERLGRQPAQHHDVGRRHEIDREVGQHDRPAQREGRARSSASGSESIAGSRPESSSAHAGVTPAPCARLRRERGRECRAGRLRNGCRRGRRQRMNSPASTKPTPRRSATSR